MSAMTAAHASFVRQPRHARHHARCVARGGAADKKVNLARRAVLVAPNASSPNRASPHVHRTAGRTSTSTHGAVSPTSADVASTSSSGTGSFDDVGTVVKKRAKKKSKRELEQERKEKLEMDSDFCRMVTRYDPSVIEKEALSKPLALARRGTKVTSAFAKLYSRKQALQDADARDGGIRWATAFKDALTSLGPLFVKLGQNLANRPDLVDEVTMEELTRLQDRVPPFPTDEAMRIIEEEAGRKPSEIFEYITPEPIAAASIGQVYRATLKSDGTDVAVKILRPGTRPQVVLDLYILRAAAEKFFDDFSRKNLGCPATLLVDEFAEKLLEELDFKQEALNLRDFRRNFSDDDSVQIPGVYTEYSGERVLVMDWQPGTRCTAPGAFESPEAMRIFLQNGVESGLRQLLDFGLFHGDPHPGNVLALPSGDIAYVDFGNVAEISRANQESLIDAVVHVMNRDYDNLAVCLSDLGFLQAGSDIEPVAKGLQEVWGDGALANMASMGNFSFRGLTREFNKLLFQYPIRVPERFSLVIRALLTQENICLTLDPKFNFLEAAFPYVARRLLTDPDPALRLRLFKVIIVKGKFDWARLRELVTMAEAGVRGGIKLPLKAAFELVGDTTKMLATDGAARSMLLDGLRAVPIREHIAQALSLGAMVMGMAAKHFFSDSKIYKFIKRNWVTFAYDVRRAFAQRTSSELPRRSAWPPPPGKGASGDGEGSEGDGGAPVGAAPVPAFAAA